MGYEEIKLLKQSEKSTVHLVREQDGERLFIRKELKGRHSVYLKLEGLTHPYLPKLYEVILTDDSTTVIEEYIEGSGVGSTELSNRQFLNIVRELCSVLEFLHGEGIIHRDIKPSNMILAKDGHIRLIDFDAARIPKDDLEQDT
ncbi:MAG: protein kinase, partial [Lachnospiraceae bacterium]|nr:protein kinase [Lachnospiraceae bacterium]